MTLLITVAVMFSIIFVFAGIHLTLNAEGDAGSRLSVRQIEIHAAENAQQQAWLKGQVNDRLARGKYGASLTVALFQAGVKLTAAEFLAINLVMIVVAFFLGWLFSRTVFAGIGLAVLAAFIPRFWLKRKKEKRLNNFGDQLPDVLNLLVGSLRSGYGLMQALRLVAQEMPSPSREEYERVTQEIAFGVPTVKSLGRLVERMESSDLEMVVAAMQVQNEVGGNLGDILGTIAETIRERIRIKGEIRSITGMQRATSYLLAVMPFILGVILLLMNPTYMMRVFVFPWFFIPMFAVVNVLIGLFIINKMISSLEV